MQPVVMVQLAAPAGADAVAPAQHGAQAFDQHQDGDGGQKHDIGQGDHQIDLTQPLKHAEQPHADDRPDRAARQHHQAHLHVDIAASPMGENTRYRCGDELVGLRADGDRRRHADEDEQRCHQKAAADAEHAGQKADQPTHAQDQQGGHCHLGDRQIDLHDENRFGAETIGGSLRLPPAPGNRAVHNNRAIGKSWTVGGR